MRESKVLRTALYALLILFTSVWVTISFMGWLSRGQQPMEVTVVQPIVEAVPPKTQAFAPTPATPPEQTSLASATSMLHGNSSSFIPPKLVRRVEPQYTADALSRKIEGKIKLSFLVMPTGSVRKIRVLHRLDTGLDRKAIEALSHWHYSPAIQHGRPTTVPLTEEIEFRLP